MKRLSIIVLLAFALVLLYGGVAYANFGPHGGYSQDTDACAGCHRAHTSFSPITWTDGFGNSHSALLVSSASTMEQFCLACHGDAAPGASTNVESGVFDGGPSSPSPGGIYATNSSFNAPLNGGGFSLTTTNGTTFNSVTSIHNIDDGLQTIWGDGSSASTTLDLTCTDCHDPHGSSNYRLLKDSVNGNAVGGYDGTLDPVNPTPTPWVVSAEQGYPSSGWLLHQPGAAQVATYFPNYTTEEYKYQPPGVGGYRSMSGWCSGCHERYIMRDDTTGTVVVPWDTAGFPDYYSYGAFEADAETTYTSETGQVGARSRHRHPVNITLAAGVGPLRALQREVVTSTVLPLEARPLSPNTRGTYDFQDYISCLTCHVAHGASVNMTGWAESSYITSSSAVVSWYPVLSTQPTVSGVQPTYSSALLRADNRGVCERCHNK